MSGNGNEGVRPVQLGNLSATATTRPDGAIIVESTGELAPYARAITDRLDHWAAVQPDKTYIADRGPDGNWRKLTYAETHARVRAIAASLLDMNLSADRPIMILSGNEIEHALLALAAMYAGIPVCPLSPAYSLVSRDYAKLRHAFDLLTPGLVYASEGEAFAAALSETLPEDVQVFTRTDPPADLGARHFDELLAGVPGEKLAAANAALGPDTIAKFLLTSGSTGMPKAVINTQRMLCANQEMIRESYTFLKTEPPVLVDWLPWNHTAGGNHNFGIVLYNGGTFYIDDGKPTEAHIGRTVRNLTEISPTLYFNVPKGYEFLVEQMQKNDAMRQGFFRDLKIMQYAGAGLAPHVWEALEALGKQTLGQKVMIITGYGSTETAPFAFTTTWVVDRPGQVGLPASGLSIKLLPSGEKTEVRLKGPTITPGYWRQDDMTAKSFDEDGYYIIGDALKFADPDNVNKGFIFDGRVSEDFKLSTGTWVNMASVRGGLISALVPLARDVVLTGLNRDHIGAMIFLDFDACRELVGDATLTTFDLANHPKVRAAFQSRLDELARKSTGSSTFVARAILLSSDPQIDAGEITDKGSINQRAVMNNRPEEHDALYQHTVPEGVIVAHRARH